MSQDQPVRSSVVSLPKRDPVALEALVETVATKVEALTAEVAREGRVVRALLGEILARLPEQARRDPGRAVDEAVAKVPDER